MRLSRKALARVVSGLLLLCATQSAVGSLYDGKYGQYATLMFGGHKLTASLRVQPVGSIILQHLISPRSVTGLEPFGQRGIICGLSVG